MKYKLGSLFDGLGGFPLSGLEHNFEPVWASEIEAFPIKVTQHHFPEMKHLGDITKINGVEIEPVDIITGGSPCQDMSVAGLRKGMKHSDFGDEEATRSGLFMEQIRIIKEMRTNDKANGRADKFVRPRFMVWENVPGAFSSNKGEDFRAVLEETAKIADETVIIPQPPKNKWSNSGCIVGDGYSIAYRTMDAQYWGVPQRRRRIFLVADFGGQSAAEVLFKREGLCRNIKESRETREGIATDAERSTRTAGFNGFKSITGSIQYKEETSPTLESNMPSNVFVYESHPNDSRVTGPCNIAPTVSSRYGTGGGNTPLVQCIEPGALSRGQGERVWDKCPTLRANMGDNQPCICIQGSMIGREDKNGPQGSGINEDVSFTLNATDRHAIVQSWSPKMWHGEEDKAGPLLSTDYKDPQCVYAVGNGQVDQSYMKDVTGALNCMHDQQAVMIIQQPTYSLDRETYNCGQNFARELGISDKNIASSLVSRGPSAVATSQCNYSVRRLTPLECERLMGFPDNYTNIPCASDSGRYKGLGNSVAIPCVDYVMEGIQIILDKEVWGE